jgi:hypothetical protein
MKITKAPAASDKIKMKTRGDDGTRGQPIMAEWWKADGDMQLAQELCGTVAYLKTNQTYRLRQLAVDIRLYSGLSVYSYAGSNVSKMDRTKTLPDDKPTYNLVQVCVDTLMSTVGSTKPLPKFLTDGGDYKERHVAQECNKFVEGEFYRTKARKKIRRMFRDGLVMGGSALKVYRDDDNKVAVDRVLQTDLYTDDNDSLNGDPQQLYQVKLVDRDRLMAKADNATKKVLAGTPNSYPDNSGDAAKTSSDQVMVIEGWKLASGDDPEAQGYIPGRHTIATINGVILDEEWHKIKFPFVFFNYSDPFLGFWGKGIATRLFGTQMTLNRILYTISEAIRLNGRPVWVVDSGAGVPSTHINNQIGLILKPKGGSKIECIVPQCNAQELYAERENLIRYGKDQEGINDMQANGEKPADLSSGQAIRAYEDVSSQRASETQDKFDQTHVDLAYLIVETAMDIAKPVSEGGIGKYSTIYPNKDGTKEIDLPKASLLKNTFVIQCFNESSLPRTPAGRIATVTEQVQAGMLSLKEGRRLMRFPDLEQNERLDNASEERIFKILDAIVESGDYTPPDIFLDLQLAQTLVVQYLNLYLAANLEEEKAELLRKFWRQVLALQKAAMPPPAPVSAPMPQAAPQAPPTSPLIPNAPMGQAA